MGPIVNLVKGLDDIAKGDHAVFMSGNDTDAKTQVTELLKRFGWQDIIDLGDINTAGGTEMLLPIWVRLIVPLSHFTGRKRSLQSSPLVL